MFVCPRQKKLENYKQLCNLAGTNAKVNRGSDQILCPHLTLEIVIVSVSKRTLLNTTGQIFM